ncbi:MAG: hypothetical protein U9O94_07195 [Nanoarchaeota archaeon]|nr:hypothetical protein [Nanoarchaeota archaeon]
MKTKKPNKNNFLIITLVLLLFIPITYSFSGTKIGSDVYVEGNSPGKLGDKTLSNAQVNIVNTLCEADRYTDRYLFPGNDVDAPGTCKTCNGAGGVGNIDDGNDFFNECNGLTCSSYYIQSGIESATTIEMCYTRANEPASTHNCNGAGACRTAAQDCPDNGQDTYQYACQNCRYISSSSCTGTTLGECSKYSVGTLHTSCSTCDDLGTDTNGWVTPQTTDWGEGLYGCTGSNQRCYRGSCYTCSGWLYQGYCFYISDFDQGCASVCGGDRHIDYFDGGGCTWNWGTNCALCKHWYPSAECFGYRVGPAYRGAPYYDCRFYDGGSQDCGTTSGDWRRICACNY